MRVYEMPVPTFSEDGLIVIADDISLRWDPEHSRPLDHEGEAGRIWERLKAEHDITEPAAYVAPPPPRRLVPKAVIVDRLIEAGKLAEARTALDAQSLDVR